MHRDCHKLQFLWLCVAVTDSFALTIFANVCRREETMLSFTFLFIKLCLHWWFFKVITPTTAIRDSHYCTFLATLGGTTWIGSFLFLGCMHRYCRKLQSLWLCVAVTDSFALTIFANVCRREETMLSFSFLFIKLYLHWWFFKAITPTTAIRDSHYCTFLATLGGTTQIGSFLFLGCMHRDCRKLQSLWLCVAVTDSFALTIFANVCRREETAEFCILFIKLCLHWWFFKAITPTTAIRDSHYCTFLATLGGTTQIRSFLF